MRQLRRHLRFAEEALLGLRMFGQLWREHLEGDQPIEALIAGQQHDTHAASPKLTLDVVLAAQGGSDRGDIAGGGISVE